MHAKGAAAQALFDALCGKSKPKAEAPEEMPPPPDVPLSHGFLRGESIDPDQAGKAAGER